MNESLALVLAYLLDLVIGDPRWLPHPVRLIGRAIEKYEFYLRKRMIDAECDVVAHEVGDYGKAENRESEQEFNIINMVPSFMKKKKGLSLDAYEKWAGVILVTVIAGATFVLFYLINSLLLLLQFSVVSSYISLALFVYLISTTMATRGLLSSVQAVINELRKGDLESSRKKLAMIVGRDTGELEETAVFRAAIETLSENASDGIVAPLFYFAIGGLPLAVTYKAINTLDSMVGYKNDKYRNLGWASAKLDDIVNYIPARITALLIIAASYCINSIRFLVCKSSQILRDVQNRVGRLIMKVVGRFEKNMEKPDFPRSMNAFEVMVRDGNKHSSPNAGMPEAAMAGALGIKLGGPSNYGGKVVNKPYIGDTARNMKNRKEPAEKLYMEAALLAIVLTKLTSFLAFIIVYSVL